MSRVVKINVKNINTATGFLISLPNDKEKDIILTVCHVFGETNEDIWEMWDVESDDVEISSDYYCDVDFEVLDVVYRNGDAEMNDFALIYVNKVNELMNDKNISIPQNEEQFLNDKVIIEGFGMDEKNNCSRVLYGIIHNFVSYEKKMYRVNYSETDREQDRKTVELNRGMSGAPVYAQRGKKQYFIGMQKCASSEETTDGILGIFTYKYSIEQVKKLYSVELPLYYDLGNLINNESLFKNLHVLHKNFDISPSDRKHIGSSITYEDTNELREDFLDELLDTMIDWVYCSEKYDELVQQSMNEGRSKANASQSVVKKIEKKFRRDIVEKRTSAYRQITELILFHFIQRFMGAVPLLRKENIYSGNDCECICSNAVHYKYESNKNVIVLGNSIIFKNTCSFGQNFEKSLDIVIDKYKNIRKDLYLYTYENFLSKEMIEIAESYLSKNMKDININLVNIVIYNEEQMLNMTDEEDIKMQIESLIENRYKDFNNNIIDTKDSSAVKRITYIIFPIWELEELIKLFQDKI